MATTDIEVSNLIINELTKAEYDAATKSDTELYFVTDEKIAAEDIEGLGEKLTTELKTINGESIVGSGDVEIKGGVNVTYDEANHRMILGGGN